MARRWKRGRVESLERERTLTPALSDREREGGSHTAAISHEEREKLRAAYWQRWLQGPRLSASQLAEQANLERIYAQRRAFQRESLLALAKNASRSVFYNLDLAHTAEAYAASGHPLPGDEAASVPLMRRVHQRMFSAVVRRQRGDARWTDDEHAAFRLLREAMIAGTRERKSNRSATSSTTRSSGAGPPCGSTWPAAGPTRRPIA